MAQREDAVKPPRGTMGRNGLDRARSSGFLEYVKVSELNVRRTLHVHRHGRNRAHRIEKGRALGVARSSTSLGLGVLLPVPPYRRHRRQKVRRDRLCPPLLLPLEGEQDLPVVDDALEGGAGEAFARRGDRIDVDIAERRWQPDAEVAKDVRARLLAG